MPEGWAAWRAARISASVALTLLGLGGLDSAKDARATTSRGPRFERR